MSRRVRIALLAVVVCAALCVAVPAPLAAAATGLAPGAVELTLKPGARSMVPTTMTTPAVLPDPDIVFLADTTGSMDPALANVRNNLSTIMSQVRASAPTARFAVAEYKEQRDGARAFRVNTPLTADSNQVLVGAQNWLYGVGGGGNPQTDFLNAHFRLATDAVAWRPQGSRVIAWFGDARSNDPSLGHTLAATTTALAGAHARVIAVPISGASGSRLNELGQAAALTQATSGVLMATRTPAEVATAIVSGIRSLTVTVTPRATCDQPVNVLPFPTSSTVRSSTAAEFRVTVGARPDAVPGNYRCTVDYLMDGRSTGFTQNVLVHVPSDQPPVRITDVSVEEGDYYATATLTVTLDVVGTKPVSVNWSTVPGTADTYDYGTASGTVTFQPGETSKDVTVTVYGDSYDEPDETFSVHLSDPTNAVIADADGVVTILDDDVTPPEMRITDASVLEGDYPDTATTTVTVYLDRASTEYVNVNWATVADHAEQTDFVAGSGQLTFAPGETSKQLTVMVIGDFSYEPNDRFSVHLSNPQGATIADADGVVTITNDDPYIG